MDSVELSLRIFGILLSFLGDKHFKARNEPSMHCKGWFYGQPKGAGINIVSALPTLKDRDLTN